jgi:hypothetical protein
MDILVVGVIILLVIFAAFILSPLLIGLVFFIEAIFGDEIERRRTK